MKVIKLLLVTLLSFISFDMYAPAEGEEPVTQGSPHTQVLKKGTPPLGSLPVKSALKLTSSPIKVSSFDSDTEDVYHREEGKFTGAGFNMGENTENVKPTDADKLNSPTQTLSRVQFKDQQIKVRAEDPSAMNDLLALNPSREELSQNEPAQAGNKGGISLGSPDINAFRTVNKTKGGAALHLAAINGKAEYGNEQLDVSGLIEKGADLDLQTQTHKDTALHLAIKNGNKQGAQALIAAGADVNAKNASGFTPLHEASFIGDTDTAKLLLENGAKVDLKSNKGNTALHVANDSEIANLLVKSGADASIKNDEGKDVQAVWKDRTVDQDVSVNAKNNKKQASSKSIVDRLSDLGDWFKSIPKSIQDSFNNTVSSIKSFFTSSSKVQQQEVADSLSSNLAAVKKQKQTYENSAPGMKDSLASRQAARKNNDANVSLEKNLTDTLSDYNKLRDFQAKGEDTTELQELFEKDLVDVVVASKNNSEMAVKIKGMLDTMDSTSNLNKSVQLQADQIIADREAQKNNPPLPSSPAPDKAPEGLGKPQVESSAGVHILLRPLSPKHQNEGVEYTDQKDEESALQVPPKTDELGYNAAPPIPGNAPQGDASPQFAQKAITPNLTTSRVASEDNADAFNDLLNLQPESVQSATRRDSQGRPLGRDGKILLPPAPPSSPMLKPAPPAEPSIAPAIKPAPPAPRSALNPDVLKALKRPTDSNQQADASGSVSPKSVADTPGGDENKEPLANALQPVKPKLSFSLEDLEGKAGSLKTTQQQAQKPVAPSLSDMLKSGKGQLRTVQPKEEDTTFTDGGSKTFNENLLAQAERDLEYKNKKQNNGQIITDDNSFNDLTDNTNNTKVAANLPQVITTKVIVPTESKAAPKSILNKSINTSGMSAGDALKLALNARGQHSNKITDDDDNDNEGDIF